MKIVPSFTANEEGNYAVLSGTYVFIVRSAAPHVSGAVDQPYCMQVENVKNDSDDEESRHKIFFPKVPGDYRWHGEGQRKPQWNDKSLISILKISISIMMYNYVKCYYNNLNATCSDRRQWDLEGDRLYPPSCHTG